VTEQVLSKLETARWILSADDLFVSLDPRGADVTVPPWLKHQPELCLQFGLNLPIHIPDMHLDDTGIYGTLSFSRTPYTCAIPWKAVFKMHTGQGLGFAWGLSEEPVKTKTLKNGWKVYEGGKK
jgi:hypothetical protein